MDEQWLARRRSGIGGSDAAAILGLNPWKSPVQVYLDKIGDLPSQEDNDRMRWGRILELPIAQEFARVTGRKLEGPCECGSKDYPWMLGNIDQLLDSDEILEVKTAGSDHGWGDPGTDQVPEYYAIQVHHYMTIGGWKKAYIAVLIKGSDFRIYEINRDPEISDMLIKAERSFWLGHVEKRIPPNIQSCADIRALFRRDSGEAVEADDSAMTHYNALLQIKYEMKKLEDAEENAKAALQVLMKSASAITNNGKVIATWKTQEAERFDSKKFKESYPDLYKMYTKITESRVFRLKETK